MNIFKNEPQKETSPEKQASAAPSHENLHQARYYTPQTDIFETDNEIRLEMDMPGVSRENLSIELKKGVLTVEGRIDLESYKGYHPVYTEYNIGNFTRSFTIGREIDSEKISARVENGVLTLTLPKASEAMARKIEVK